MTSRLNPYISFTDNARQAMEFYQGVFGGNLTISTFGEFGAPDESIANLVMHAMLVTDAGYTLMGADTPPDRPRNHGDHITISLSGDDGALLRGYFEGLAAGGQITMPLEKQMWGDEFGQLTDQFNINWMVNIGQ